MTVESTLRKNTYTGNGATATYNYGFRVFTITDLIVTKISPAPAEIETVLTPNTDFTATKIGNAAGGTITLTAGNLPTGWGLRIERVLPFVQLADLRNAGGFYPEVHEEALDKLCMMIQQLSESDVAVLAISVTNLTTEVNNIDVRVTNLEGNDAYKDVPMSATVSGTLTYAERGKCIPATGNITLPANIFPSGGTFNIMNDSASPITIIQGAGLTLRNSGSGSTGNRTLAAYGLVNVLYRSPTVAHIAGPGLT